MLPSIGSVHQQSKSRECFGQSIPQLDRQTFETAPPVPSIPIPEALRMIRDLAESQNLLDALGTGLQAGLDGSARVATAESEDAVTLQQVVDVLWQKCGWEPHMQEKHEYSLLHPLPESEAAESVSLNSTATAPTCFRSVTETTTEKVAPPRHDPELIGHQCPVVDAKGCLFT